MMKYAILFSALPSLAFWVSNPGRMISESLSSHIQEKRIGLYHRFPPQVLSFLSGGYTTYLPE